MNEASGRMWFTSSPYCLPHRMHLFRSRFLAASLASDQ